MASSNSFFPDIPVDKIIGMLVSAIAAKRGKLVKSLLATLRVSGVNNFRRDRHPKEHSVSTNSNPLLFAYL